MKGEVPVEITEAAYDWLDLLSSDDVSEEVRTQFVDWIHQSPVHVAEFLTASALHAEMSASMTGDQPWLDELLQEDVQGILQMPIPMEEGETHTPSQSAFKGSWMAIAASFLAAVSVMTWMYVSEESSRIATVVGEMRVIVLEDGSRLELNTDSEVKVRFGTSVREVELIRGELMVNVEMDISRPFIVRVDNVDVTAIGTQFNVYRKPNATEVTVIEGRVVLDWYFGSETKRHVELDAGLKAIIAENSVEPALSPANIESTTAWSERRLSFDDTPVAEVAAEFNRYNRSRVLISDPLLAQRRISGVFDVNDPGAFISLLQGLEEIDIQVVGDGHRNVRVKEDH